MTNGSWHLYIVRCSDGSLYCGITTNVSRRVRAHNGIVSGGAKYTRSRRPVTLVHSLLIGEKSAALRAEAKFKALSRPKKIERIEEWKAAQRA